MAPEIEKHKEESGGTEEEEEEVKVRELTAEEKAKLAWTKSRSHWQIGFKILQIIVASGCIGCVFEPVEKTGLGKTKLHHVGIMYTAFSSFILINSVLLASKLVTKCRVPFVTYALFSLLGAILNIIAAILLIIDKGPLTRYYGHQENKYLMSMLLGATILSFVNALLYVVDAALTLIKKKDF